MERRIQEELQQNKNLIKTNNQLRQFRSILHERSEGCDNIL